MELKVFFAKVRLFLMFCEMVLLGHVESLVGPEQFPLKLNHNLRQEKGEEEGDVSSEETHMQKLSMNFSISVESLEQSKMLEFIDTIRTNVSARTELCKQSKTQQSISLSDFNYKFKASSFTRYKHQSERGRFISRYLTTLYTHNSDVQFQSFTDEDVPAIISILRLIVEDDPHIAGGGIAFATNFFPYVTKNTNDITTKDVEDFSKYYPNFTNQDFYSVHSKNRLTTNAGSSPLPVEGIFWGQPYYDCYKLKRWIVGVSFPFYNNATKSEFKGVVLLDIDLNQTSINQCDDSDTVFAGSHKCRPETTRCKYVPFGMFASGNYECHCRSGFYFPNLNASQKYFTGTQLEHHFLSSMRGDLNVTSEYQCLPCRQGCADCDNDGPCFVEYNILLRGVPLGFQSFCMTITLVLGIVVLRVRKCKVMVIGMWCLLEIILLGAVLLYATVVVQYFEPSSTICLIVPWLRELGFAILYGALVLKIYRLLADFQSRKAHRVHVRDKDLLKYLLSIVVVVIGYMAAWTSVNIDQVQEGASLIDIGLTEDRLRYRICRSGWWDYSTEFAEILFLLFGLYLCYRVRAAPAEFREGFYISLTILLEFAASLAFYVVRHIYWLTLHPDYLFLMYFLRCQVTVSTTLVLVFGPKLWYAHRPLDDRNIRNRAYSTSDVPDNMAPEAMKLNVGISSNGDVDVGDVSLADMDPEDIRVELKRLYTQLQVYKTRNMRRDNPHISKRRGGRKQTHRRFSLQAAFHHKHKHHHDHDHEHEMSKTPEESTNSAEGLPMPVESSATKCDDVNEVKPTVSFKMAHSHK